MSFLTMLIGFGVFFLAIVSCEYSFKSALVEVRRKGVKEFSERYFIEDWGFEGVVWSILGL